MLQHDRWGLSHEISNLPPIPKLIVEISNTEDVVPLIIAAETSGPHEINRPDVVVFISCLRSEIGDVVSTPTGKSRVERRGWLTNMDPIATPFDGEIGRAHV